MVAVCAHTDSKHTSMSELVLLRSSGSLRESMSMQLCCAGGGGGAVGGDAVSSFAFCQHSLLAAGRPPPCRTAASCCNSRPSGQPLCCCSWWCGMLCVHTNTQHQKHCYSVHHTMRTTQHAQNAPPNSHGAWAGPSSVPTSKENAGLKSSPAPMVVWRSWMCG